MLRGGTWHRYAPTMWSGGVLDAARGAWHRYAPTQHDSPLSFPRTRGNQKGTLWGRRAGVAPC